MASEVISHMFVRPLIVLTVLEPKNVINRGAGVYCRQQFAILANCYIVTILSHKIEFANTSLLCEGDLSACMDWYLY